MTTTTTVQPPSVITQNPNDLLASQITETLLADKLIKDAHKGQLLAKLKAGGVKQEDWNLWIDMATTPEATKEEPHL